MNDKKGHIYFFALCTVSMILSTTLGSESCVDHVVSFVSRVIGYSVTAERSMATRGSSPACRTRAMPDAVCLYCPHHENNMEHFYGVEYLVGEATRKENSQSTCRQAGLLHQRGSYAIYDA